MTLDEIRLIASDMAPVVRGYVEQATAPLHGEIGALKRQNAELIADIEMLKKRPDVAEVDAAIAKAIEIKVSPGLTVEEARRTGEQIAATACEPLTSRIERLERQLTEEIAARGELVDKVDLDDLLTVQSDWTVSLEDVRRTGEQLAKAATEHVDEQASALRAEVAELKALVEAIPEPVETPDVKSLVEAEVAKLPVARDGEPGKDAEPINYLAIQQMVELRVHEALAEIPRPEPLPAPTLTDLAPMVDEAVQRGLSALPVAKDGKDAAQMVSFVKDHTGALIVTLSDGRVIDTGIRDGLNGKDGEQGPAGFSLLSFDSEIRDGGRTWVVTFEDGELKQTIEHQLDTMIFRGGYKAGQTYQPGDTTSCGGQLYHCNAETTDRPDGNSDAWVLCSRRGRDGRDADPAPLLRLIEDNSKDAEERLMKRLEAFLRSKGLI